MLSENNSSFVSPILITTALTLHARAGLCKAKTVQSDLKGKIMIVL